MARYEIVVDDEDRATEAEKPWTANIYDHTGRPVVEECGIGETPFLAVKDLFDTWVHRGRGRAMTRDDPWLLAWLGDVEATDDQRAALLVAAETIARRWPDPDDEGARREAFTGAAQVILDGTPLEDAARAWQRVRRVERDAMAALTGAIIASGETEAEIVRRTGVTHMAVRKARGPSAEGFPGGDLGGAP